MNCQICICTRWELDSPHKPWKKGEPEGNFKCENCEHDYSDHQSIDPQTILNRAHFHIRDSYHKGERGNRASGTSCTAKDGVIIKVK